jgi:hypothetical protein
MKIIRLPFSAPKFVEHEVAGNPEKFYQCSTRVLCRLRTLAGPVLKAFGDLFSDKKNDYSTRNTSTTQDGAKQETLEVNASGADVLRMRAEQRRDAIQSLITGVASDDSMHVLAEIVMDSMRDCYQGEASPEDTKRFLRDTPGEVFMEMLVGVAKAHDKLFSPFLGRVKEAASTLKDALAAKVSDLTGKEQKEASETPSPASGPA